MDLINRIVTDPDQVSDASLSIMSIVLEYIIILFVPLHWMHDGSYVEHTCVSRRVGK